MCGIRARAPVAELIEQTADAHYEWVTRSSRNDDIERARRSSARDDVPTLAVGTYGP
jgi:hypothetical protein